jgi:hypothetical protein
MRSRAQLAETESPAEELWLRLSIGSSLLFVGERPAIYSEERRKLFQLNELAAYIGCRLEDGVRFRDLREDLTGRGLDIDSATRSIVDLLLAWSREGLATADLEAPPREPIRSQSIRMANGGALIRYHDAGLATRIAPVFEHLRVDLGTPGTHYDVRLACGMVLISKDAGPALIVTPRQAAPALKGCLTEDVLENPCWTLALHAACLIRNDRAILLSGRPGAGKTTLALWMLAAGFEYGGDDITLMDSDGRFQGAPFAPAVKSGSWHIVRRIRPDLGSALVHDRLDGKRVRYMPPQPLAKIRPMPLGAVIVLKRNRSGQSLLTPLEPAILLPKLIDGATSVSKTISRRTLQTLVRGIAGARRCELTYSDPEEAAQTLRNLSDDAQA